ncbi:hypothetical protein NQ315_010206 [Exocentrus adspersus]|uniref:Phenoloxidase-activating factor 2 n=1 Tax=Exocentrus adspersus TaxID=1586481 RepID=A0AAV8WAK7_9CUCU|nr:hypothetical protein NQ315_010206 [Exocentrus adspersus]
MCLNRIIAIILLNILQNSACHILKNDHEAVLINKPRITMDKEELFNRDHIRRKRYIGLRFKLNKRYQECIGPGDTKGHCKHLPFCRMDVMSNSNNQLEFLCIIEKAFVGVCCPDDIASSGTTGSQLVMDLPAGGYDYDDNATNTGCGVSTEGRSFSTRRSGIQEWPWIAALYRPKQLQQGLEQQFCGGSLITDTHILTASHCVQGLTPAEIRVRLGEYNFATPNESRSRDYGVVEIIEHEGFVLSTYENDIAIVKMDKPTMFNTYIWPICLPPVEETFENKMAVVAGWGQQYYAGPTSEVLLQVEVPVWQHQKCVDAFVQRITDDNICAAGYEGGKDSCLGDSGGPLMFQLNNGRWVTIGVVSWGIGCGNKDSPGIYTKVNKFIPWIIKNTITKK